MDGPQDKMYVVNDVQFTAQSGLTLWSYYLCTQYLFFLFKLEDIYDTSLTIVYYF